jgi:hypothetical protein
MGNAGRSVTEDVVWMHNDELDFPTIANDRPVMIALPCDTWVAFITANIPEPRGANCRGIVPFPAFDIAEHVVYNFANILSII